jgi:hypothetical protein
VTPLLYCKRTMADIAHRIKLYNQAFQLAHEHVAKDDVTVGRPSMVKALHDLIRREIAVGIDDPVSIAATAVRELEARSRVHAR